MLVDRVLCTGCGACVVVCPKQCITMSADAEGFRYPIIHKASCIQCGKCVKACPLTYERSASHSVTAYAMQNRDETTRLESSSGGVFSALAEWVIEQGGWVCGASYENDFVVRHQIVNTVEQLVAFRGAKYAQSECEHCFADVQRYLDEGCPVLFSGTPCQIAGLQRFLHKPYDALYLVDMICHGVPSPWVWKCYLEERRLAEAPEAEIQAVNMRSKRTGWSRYGYCTEVRYTSGKISAVPQGEDGFVKGFVSNLYLRPSCSDCHFKGIYRSSDITLADYWGVWDQHPSLDDNKGTSLVLAHTAKGQALLREVDGRLYAQEVKVYEAVLQNSSAVRSSAPHPNREAFFVRLTKGKSVLEQIDRLCKSPKKTILQRIIGRLGF